MFRASDKLKNQPCCFHVSGRYVAIGGKITDSKGNAIEQANQDDYKYLFDLFQSKGLTDYIIKEDVRDTEPNSENNRKRKRDKRNKAR